MTDGQSASGYDLVILAAGMGSRYGGLKQVDPVGPRGEIVLEYSLYDALRAGFRRAVLVIRKDMEEEFRATVGRRIEPRMDIHYAYQEQEDLPRGAKAIAGRTKPWGTGHAVWAAREAVKGPFAVINADDFYGPMAYRLIALHLGHADVNGMSYGMIGFPLLHTLSDHGAVSRGICHLDRHGFLKSIEEKSPIERDGDHGVWRDPEGGRHPLPGDTVASMNFWGFTPSLFGALEQDFSGFLATRGDEPGAEFYLPAVIDGLVASGKATVKVGVTPDAWLGVTYREDKPLVAAGILRRIREGIYPESLWD
ncbi:MAG TPA: nucleotidyltransferase [Kiritimatiellia bacterium]|nr:nucleotidyltransferase [Kiritimatiellia bacterium]